MTANGSNGEFARQKRQRARSIAIAVSLGAMALLFYAATIVRLGPNAMRKDEFGSAPGTATATESDACKKAGTC